MQTSVSSSGAIEKDDAEHRRRLEDIKNRVKAELDVDVGAKRAPLQNRKEAIARLRAALDAKTAAPGARVAEDGARAEADRAVAEAELDLVEAEVECEVAELEAELSTELVLLVAAAATRADDDDALVARALRERFQRDTTRLEQSAEAEAAARREALRVRLRARHETTSNESEGALMDAQAAAQTAELEAELKHEQLERASEMERRREHRERDAEMAVRLNHEKHDRRQRELRANLTVDAAQRRAALLASFDARREAKYADIDASLAAAGNKASAGTALRMVQTAREASPPMQYYTATILLDEPISQDYLVPYSNDSDDLDDSAGADDDEEAGAPDSARPTTLVATFALPEQSLAEFDEKVFIELIAKEMDVDPSKVKLTKKRRRSLMKVDAVKKRAQISRRFGDKKKSKRKMLESADASADERAAAERALDELEREEAAELATLETVDEMESNEVAETATLKTKLSLMKVDAVKKRAQISRRFGDKKKSKRKVIESADASADERAAAERALDELEREEAAELATLETELKVAQKQEDILEEDAEMAALESEVEAPDQELGGVMFEVEIEDVDDAKVTKMRASTAEPFAFADAMEDQFGPVTVVAVEEPKRKKKNKRRNKSLRKKHSGRTRKKGRKQRERDFLRQKGLASDTSKLSLHSPKGQEIINKLASTGYTTREELTDSDESGMSIFVSPDKRALKLVVGQPAKVVEADGAATFSQQVAEGLSVEVDVCVAADEHGSELADLVANLPAGTPVSSVAEIARHFSELAAIQSALAREMAALGAELAREAEETADREARQGTLLPPTGLHTLEGVVSVIDGDDAPMVKVVVRPDAEHEYDPEAYGPHLVRAWLPSSTARDEESDATAREEESDVLVDGVVELVPADRIKPARVYEFFHAKTNARLGGVTLAMVDADDGGGEIARVTGNNAGDFVKLPSACFSAGAARLVASRAGFVDTSWKVLALGPEHVKPVDVEKIFLLPRAPPEDARARARVRTEVVLSWQARPRDLDLHCVSSLGDHVYYANMTSRDRAVKLDIDVLDGYGPETLVIDSNGDRAFVVYVLNFSCEADIAQCQAKLSVVPGDGTSPFEIAVPSAGVTGFPQFWKAFEIDAFGHVIRLGPAPARDGVLCVTEHDAQAPHFCPGAGKSDKGVKFRLEAEERMKREAQARREAQRRAKAESGAAAARTQAPTQTSTTSTQPPASASATVPQQAQAIEAKAKSCVCLIL